MNKKDAIAYAKRVMVCSSCYNRRTLKCDDNGNLPFKCKRSYDLEWLCNPCSDRNMSNFGCTDWRHHKPIDLKYFDEVNKKNKLKNTMDEEF